MDENECSNRVIGAAIEVHRELGPGLLESAYRQALEHELRMQGLQTACEIRVSMAYKGLDLPDAFRIDLLVQDMVIVEIKAVEKLVPVHRAQLLTYLRGSNRRLGLLLNFHETVLKKGIVRVVNEL